jgi:hypothetical protein
MMFGRVALSPILAFIAAGAYVQPQMGLRPPLLSALRTLTPRMSSGVSVEDAIALFGRVADSKHVFDEPIRTAASGFEFSVNSAIKPKWLVAYASRTPGGEDVQEETHASRWSQLLFPGDATVCSRDAFDAAFASAEFTTPLGTPKWSVPGEKLVDTAACAQGPSAAALDALWAALGGGSAGLQREDVIANLRSWAAGSDTGDAVLFAEFAAALRSAA